MSERGVSVLVVSGFLGSGKTTLVRRLLDAAQAEGVRLAVVSNEFGELGIDAAILGDQSAVYVELEGGCVCCKLSDELVSTLQELHERARPERIVIETSGVALPYETQLQLWREPIASWIADSLAVVVVNAGQLASGRDLDGTFDDQVSSADLLLLNQVDCVEPGVLPELERQLAELAPDAPLLRCVRADVPSEVLFPTVPSDTAASLRPRDGVHTHTHESYESEQLAIAAGTDEDELRARLSALGALRVKGFVITSQGLRLVQGVGPRIELETPSREPDPAKIGRVVVIRRRSVS